MELNLIQQAAERREQLKNNITNSFNPLSEQSIEQLVKSEEDQFDWLEKGKRIRAVIGEKRTHGGREYIRTMDGWKYHGKGTGVKATAHRESSLSHHVEAGKSRDHDDLKSFSTEGLDQEHANLVIISKDKKMWRKDHQDRLEAVIEEKQHRAALKAKKEDTSGTKSDTLESKEKSAELDKKETSKTLVERYREIKHNHDNDSKQISHNDILDSMRETHAASKNEVEAALLEHGESKIGFTTPTKPTKTMTFKEILADSEGKKLIEAIEHGSSDPAIINDLKDQLKSKFGYQYDETVSSKDTAKKDKFFEDQKGTKSTSKHIGDMTFTEKKAAAKQLGIDPTGKTVGQLNKELADKNVDKALQEWKDKRKGKPGEKTFGGKVPLKLKDGETGKKKSESYEITRPIIDFLDRHEFSSFEAKDSNYISDKIHNYAENVGIKFTDKEAVNLAKQYYKIKYN